VLLDHARYCDDIVSQAEGLARLLAGADCSAPVPTCPGWTLADLADHVTRNLRGLLDAVAGAEERRVRLRAGGGVVGAPVRPRRSGSDAEPRAPRAPSGAGAAARAITPAATDVAAALRHAGPNLRIRWCGLDGSSCTWARRGAHDLLIHRADAALALGVPFTASADAGADALDELLELLGGPPVPRPAERPEIELRATDTGQSWSVTPDGRAFTWRRGPTRGAAAAVDDAAAAEGRRAGAQQRTEAQRRGAGRAALVGPLTALLLVTYRRADPRQTTSFDDAELIDPWIAALALT